MEAPPYGTGNRPGGERSDDDQDSPARLVSATRHLVLAGAEHVHNIRRHLDPEKGPVSEVLK